MTFNISLAGFVFRIDSLYDEIYNMCSSYIVSSEDVDFTIKVCKEDIEKERERARLQEEREGRCHEDFSASYLETLAVYRRIAETMPEHDVFLIHGSALAVGDSCYLFKAPSGVGKTTHTELWLENIKGSFIVNGDKPLIRRFGDNFILYGTPWAGKEGWNRNTSVPLKGIVFLNRGLENRIWRVSASDMLPFLISQTYRPSDIKAQKKTLELLQSLWSHVPFYKLECNMDKEAALIAYEGISCQSGT